MTIHRLSFKEFISFKCFKDKDIRSQFFVLLGGIALYVATSFITKDNKPFGLKALFISISLIIMGYLMIKSKKGAINFWYLEKEDATKTGIFLILLGLLLIILIVA